MRGRKPIAIFSDQNSNLNEVATRIGNKGAYTVESSCSGLCYFLYEDRIAIASQNGTMTIHITTAQTIADELGDILEDYRHWQREGRHPMDSRAIGKMLESDFA